MVFCNWWEYFTERAPQLDHISLRHIADTICPADQGQAISITVRDLQYIIVTYST